MSGNMGEMMDKLFDNFFDMILTKETEEISGWKEIELINKTKENLFVALEGFGPDLPAQYSTQIASRAIKMRANNEILRERSELESFLIAYKLELETILTMISEDKKEHGESRKEQKVDDMKNVREKMQKYQSYFEKIYAKSREHGIENINLIELEKRSTNMAELNSEKVERQKEEGNK